MKHTHTPGPWKFQDLGTLLDPMTGTPLTTARIRTSLGAFEILDETKDPEGNRMLIESAPDLLAALEAVVDAYGCECVSEEPKPHCPMCIGRAALAKAKGE